jgi:hypothetical protein
VKCAFLDIIETWSSSAAMCVATHGLQDGASSQPSTTSSETELLFEAPLKQHTMSPIVLHRHCVVVVARIRGGEAVESNWLCLVRSRVGVVWTPEYQPTRHMSKTSLQNSLNQGHGLIVWFCKDKGNMCSSL